MSNNFGNFQDEDLGNKNISLNDNTTANFSSDQVVRKNESNPKVAYLHY